MDSTDTSANETSSPNQQSMSSLQLNTTEIVTPSIPETMPQVDEYSYTRIKGQSSSELYKIEVRNLPRYASYALFKKMMQNKLKLKPNKLKMIKDGQSNTNTLCYVTFNSEEDRNQALDSLSNFIWKNCTLSAAIAAPKADPLVTKRLLDAKECSDTLKKSRLCTQNIEREIINPAELACKLNEQVAPLYKLDYDAQLVKKYESICQLMTDFQKSVGKIFDTITPASEERDALFSWYLSSRRSFDKKLCPVESVVTSPLTEGYRNKCEFSIGLDCTIGFRLGCYKDGSLQVAPINSCPLVPKAMVSIVSSVQEYLKDHSKFVPFDQLLHTGNYKQLTVRTNSHGESLVILVAACYGLSAQEIADEKKQINDHFSAIASDLKLTSFYFENASINPKDASRLELIIGQPCLTESITVCEKKLQFNISPDAFFQINSQAAGICYTKIASFASLTPDTLLIDVCCGTGTIGLSLASQVSKVIGIELNANAVKDAQENAKLNGISNATFYAGKAEDVLNRVCNPLNSTEKEDETTDSSGDNYDSVVAIIDPPRAGLNQCVMKVLRGTERISKVIYVSCEPRFALHNFIDLVRPVSKAYKGSPFVPTKAVPVDLFPHTAKCELILVFERLQVSNLR